MPLREEEWIHRNGRTARMQRKGTAYLLVWEEDQLPEYIKDAETEELVGKDLPEPTAWTTLFISGGRKDKISKGDIAGFFMKQGNVQKDALSLIELKQDCAFVGIKKTEAQDALHLLNNTRLKKKKVRIYEI